MGSYTTTLLLSSSQQKQQQILESLKMAKMIFVLALMVAVASTQPIDTIATSGGVSLSTQLWNWGQAAFEALVALVVKAFEPLEPSRDETISKLLILTGDPINEAKKIEVVDLQNPQNSCSLPEEFPTRLSMAVGGFTQDGPLLCGGYNYDTRSKSNACFTLKDSKFVEADVKLQTERSSASAVVLPNGEVGIQGGVDGNRRLST